MDGLQIFILCILGIIAMVGIHRRYMRYRLIDNLVEKGKSADEIDIIVKAYKEIE